MQCDDVCIFYPCGVLLFAKPGVGDNRILFVVHYERIRGEAVGFRTEAGLSKPESYVRLRNLRKK